MSEHRDDGGPAFPMQDSQARKKAIGGLSMLDYFAAKAMQAYISSDKWREEATYFDTAQSAYSMADAMLQARKVKP